MDPLDSSRQRAVWQRVTEAPKSGEDGFGLLPAALTLANAYRQLAASLPGAKRLLEEQNDTVACLRGLMRLGGRRVTQTKPASPGQNGQEALLIFCYRQSRRAAAEYLARSADPETGVVFRLLSDRASDHCALIAALLGR